MKSPNTGPTVGKKTYAAPVLKTYGSVRELTAGTGGVMEDPGINMTALLNNGGM